MQCKAIPDRPILEFLARQEWPSTWCEWTGGLPTVAAAMPDGTPGKLRLAKMNMLIRRGLVDGCGCGCRGDFIITDKGRELIA